MSVIDNQITNTIGSELSCINQNNINKAISLGWSQKRFLFTAFYKTQDSRKESYFGDGIGTHGTFTLDVKDEHIHTMLKKILKNKGLEYKVVEPLV